jgi:ribosomal RNA assembly protein
MLWKVQPKLKSINFIYAQLFLFSMPEIEEYEYELKIPKERVAILIGIKGKVKKQFEEYGQCRIEVDSKEGDVKLSGKDSVKLYMMRDLIKAIGRGFNPDIAQLLLKQDYCLEVISLTDFARSPESMQRLKGRVIGAKGKSRSIIEKLTETFISVYGKTISIIGTTESVAVAKRAIETLLEGGQHSAVYKSLEKARRELKRREIEGM